MIRAIDMVTDRLWAIHPDSLRQVASIALRDNESPEAVAAKLGRPLQNTRKGTIRNNIAIIPVTGPIFPRANMMTEVSGATSLSILSADLHQAIEDDGVTGIILEIDSPGGVAFGPGEMADMIRKATAIKPIVAYVSGMACSAAYWIASAASEIVAHRTAELGSIGVVQAMSVQENPDANGHRTIEIVSSNAKNKRPDPRTDEGMAEIRRSLDSMEVEFIASVATFRGVSTSKVKQEFGGGGVLIAADAIRAGMADRLGSFEDLLAEMSNRPQTNQGDRSMTTNTNPAPALETPAAMSASGLKQNHPAIAQEIRAEGYNAGVIAERERILSIEDIAKPGHEDIVEAAKRDGKSTAGEVAVKMVTVEKQRGEKWGSAIIAEAALTPAIAPSIEGNPGAPDANLPLEERAKAQWDRDPKLRAEFGNKFSAYLAFEKNAEAGNIRIKSK